jgi:hypothetical protein
MFAVPGLWFGFLDRFRDKLASLGEIAEIRHGIASSKNDFFFTLRRQRR